MRSMRGIPANIARTPGMQGHIEVIDYLKMLLKGELAARDQYFIHSRLYEDMGFAKLHERISHEMEEETQHADAILKRILFLEGLPDMVPDSFSFGQTVPEMIKLDLALDYQARDILLVQLKDTEEDHAYWLEIQLGLIDRLGLENYLQSQM